MSLKTFIIKQAAAYISHQIEVWKKNAVRDQHLIRKSLIKAAKNTMFGKDHHFSDIHDYASFKKNVALRDYEALKPYIDRIVNGESDILWPGKPKYFAKTSGTTSGIKYIPISRESMPNHMNTARNAMLHYLHKSGSADVFKGKLIFLSGSPILDLVGGIPTGRLSGIVNHEVPSWIKTNQLPSYATNCIEEWEQKLDRIVDETLQEDMRLISGIPPWVQMYYERLLQRTGKKTVLDVFPNYQLFMYGGVNFEPYRLQLERLVGKKMAAIETYPASEGFIAFQDEQGNDGLLLNTNSGIFFEFIPLENAFDENPDRMMLEDVVIGQDYALVINNNAGLWAYAIGDCVRFTSLDPYKLIVTGRVKHFISAFGEHVIGKEVEEAMLVVADKYRIGLVEFTVAPNIQPIEGGLPYHEWFVEFENMPENLDLFAKEVDSEMCKQNIYYDDLIKGKILQTLKITIIQKDGFRNYMKSIGKLGGQNKVPRLSNDRILAEALHAFVASAY